MSASPAREELVATIESAWAEVLGLRAVGPHEPFLALGGNSVAAMWIVARLEELLGIEISVRTLLETGTVAGMAAHVEAQVGLCDQGGEDMSWPTDAGSEGTKR